MTQKMIINAVDEDDVRVAIVEDGILQHFEIESNTVSTTKGNIYLGRVKAVEPSLNAAFVHYGPEKQGFLTAGDVRHDGDKNLPINKLLKRDQQILVQVSKDEVGTKGAVLTTYLSLPGRYLVLMPQSSTQGVSRKISDEDERRKLQKVVSKLALPDDMGVIIRTAGKERTKTELNRDLKVLLRLWDKLQKAEKKAKAPALLFKEQDVIIRTLRDFYAPGIDEIILDSDDAFDKAHEYMEMVMPKHRGVLTRYVERRPIFYHYRIEEQLETLYVPRVPLPTGGSLVIEQTEALVAIDVNSGKQKSSDQEGTALQTNLAAAKEVARQLRLRDMGGIVVVDFIDMVQRKNQQKVERALRTALKNDKARVKVGRILRNGTLELTRQRTRSALQKSLFETCPVCSGTGHILTPSTHALAVLRRLRDRAAQGDLKAARVRLEAEAANILRTERWSSVQALQERHQISIEILPDQAMRPGQDDFSFETDPNAVAVAFAEPNFGPAPVPDAWDDDDLDDDDDEDEFDDDVRDEDDDFDEDDDDQGDFDDDDEDDLDDEDDMADTAEDRRRGRRGSRRRGRGGDEERGEREGRRGGGRGRDRAVALKDEALEANLGQFANIPTFEFLDDEASSGGDDRRREGRGRGGRGRSGRSRDGERDQDGTSGRGRGGRGRGGRSAAGERDGDERESSGRGRRRAGRGRGRDRDQDRDREQDRDRDRREGGDRQAAARRGDDEGRTGDGRRRRRRGGRGGRRRGEERGGPAARPAATQQRGGATERLPESKKPSLIKRVLGWFG